MVRLNRPRRLAAMLLMVSLWSCADDNGPGTPVAAAGPTVESPERLYPYNRTHSPINQQVVDRLRAIAANGEWDPHEYFKIGDSNSDNGNFMRIFGVGGYDLDRYGDLEEAVEWFGCCHIFYGPACLSGTVSAYAITGDPSPLQQSMQEFGGRFAVIMYGTNQEPYDVFEANMRTLVAKLVEAGIIPILSTIPTCLPCTQFPNTRYNNIIRKIAEDNLIPLVDLRRETDPLPSFGLVDGIHLDALNSGGDLTATGLQYGFNVRNLLTLQALRRARDSLLDGKVWDP